MKPFNISRRRFLKGSLAAGAAGLLPNLIFSGSAEAAASAVNVVIVVHLDGGWDGLNTVVPFADPAYAAARPTLAIPGEDVLPITGTLGFHPALTGLKTLYDQGKVAVVNGVGYPNFNRSHFAAEDIYWTADPASAPSTGWLGRGLDVMNTGNVMSGIYIGSATPLSMVADTVSVPAIPSATSYTFQSGGNAADDAAVLSAAVQIIDQPVTGITMIDGILAQDRALRDSIGQVAAAAAYQTGVTYANDSFSRSMKFAAQLIHANIGVRIISTDFGSFDTHSGQPARLNTLLGNLSAGIASFQQDALAGGFANRVAVMFWSEFGRRVVENASAGTDHGTSAPIIVVGEGVKGGVIGAYPSLTDLTSGDLKMGIDFRSVYASVLSDWLAVNDSQVLGASWTKQPIFL
ncbi:MAG: hypothetical protein A2150_08060 [Candidatus Muproteobacteria bacterium RBG_16_64_11]|uniref:DUF1501 domain-containing protein n=1 Tax=Candidatus Muproteobacteria bacterium RBG_16_64_11 TaxID=1817758 RepID=A0A1F6TAI8_9PROT|nr:MAG: hypothetical protein A2150_08060 [Candidatus Muproteobacteria bacterium RBG_16_64_11]